MRNCVLSSDPSNEAGGLVGWGESHHVRAHTAVAKLIESTLKQLVVGMDAADKDGKVWPIDKPGLGLEVDEAFLTRHPAIEGPGYI